TRRETNNGLNGLNGEDSFTRIARSQPIRRDARRRHITMADVLERGRVAAAEMARLATAILDRVPEEHRPLLLAMLERGAGARYRRWAEQGDDRAERDGLVTCAGREEAIADKVEAMGPKAGDILARFEAHRPAPRAAYA